ncbi:hypothetical protein ACL9RF_03665 [Sphingobacterium sp. Mn56C]|uniref:hypothetical protein n=1 Tax=Sphingobacterium sp. Mn56C TaxID=3395261 RepID=UPI003BE3E916
MDSSERNQEFDALIQAKQEWREMEAVQKEREEEEQAQDNRLVVVHGAKIKMDTHLGELQVLLDVPTTQGKRTATVAEHSIANFTFDDSFQLIAVLGEWKDVGNYKVQGTEVLLQQSTLQVMGKMPGNTPPEVGIIEILDSGQIHRPGSICAVLGG